MSNVAVAPRPRLVSAEDDKRMELTEHLGELRSRILRSILYVTGGSVLSYYIFRPLYGFLFRPMAAALTKYNAGSTAIDELKKAGFTDAQIKALQHVLGPFGLKWQIVITHFPDAFFVVLKICVVAGLI